MKNDKCTNKLLLLWQAAVKLEGSEIDRMIIHARQKRTHTLNQLNKNTSTSASVQNNSSNSIIHSIINSSNNNGINNLNTNNNSTISAASSCLSTSASSLSSCSKQSPNEKNFPKNSHNETERTRRAHLRQCMEELKKKLVFNNDFNFSRITMLNILRKASSTIRHRERTILNLFSEENMTKTRNTQLKQRLSTLERQIQVLQRNYQNHLHQKHKSDNYDKRIRNCSECSMLTTSSEDSQLCETESKLLFFHQNNHQPTEFYPSKIMKINKQPIFMSSSSLSSKCLSHQKCLSPCSASSDSGFDDFSVNKKLSPTRKLISNTSAAINTIN